MRIPRSTNQLTKIIATNTLADVKTSLSRAARVATNLLEISRPSDAPNEWNAVYRLESASADQDVFRVNADTSLAYLDGADEVLSEAAEVMKRALQVTVQQSNGVLNADARAAAAEEVRELRSHMLNLANTKITDRFVFAGQASDTVPFPTTGVYAGSANEIRTQTGYGEYVTTGYDGSSIFQGTVDIFQTLEDLTNDLVANNEAGIRSALPDITDGFDQLIQARQEVGVNQGRAEDTISLTNSVQAIIDTRLSEKVQADPVEAYSNLTELQTNYQATLQVLASRSSSMLFNFIN